MEKQSKFLSRLSSVKAIK